MVALPVLLLAAHLVPARVEARPDIDGRLGDAAWTAVPGSSAFTQKFPNDGDAPADPTTVRVAYDDDDLYIAVDCPQSVPVIARLTRRDREVENDRISIDLDTRGDGRTAYHFEVSAAGVQIDGVRFGDTDLGLEWDETWESEVDTRADGWSAELRIPLRALRLSGADNWGLQVRRWVVERGETDEWAHISRSEGGEVSRYGTLGPFEVKSTGASVELRPFVLGRLVRQDMELGGSFDDGASWSAGLDVKFRPAPSLLLTGAVLPDFGQVEADEVIVNLTNVETYLPEKRPFFLDGVELFQTPLTVLYSRRIGRDTAPVLGAAKLIATTGAGELGVLSALTGGVDDVAAPTAFHVARAQVHRDNLSVGAVGTAAMRYGSMTEHDTYVGGADAAWRSGSGDWAATTQVVGSVVEYGDPRTLDDGTTIKSGDGGAGLSAYVARQGGSVWLGELQWESFSRRLDLNDVGYLDRANAHHVFGQLEAHDADGFGPFVEASVRGEVFGRMNVDGLFLGGGYQLNASATTPSQWSTFTEVHWRPAGYDDREFGDGRALQRIDYFGWELEIETDPRKVITAAASSTFHLHAGGLFEEAGLRVGIQPRSNIELSLEPGLLLSTGDPRFLEDEADGTPRFADLDARSWSATLRATWTPHRLISVQAYLQALRASYRWSDARTATAGDDVIDLDELMAAPFDASAYNAGEGALNASVTVRWEYLPGSTAYLVYSHAQPNAGGERPVLDPRSLRDGPAGDAVLVKVIHGLAW